MRRLVRFVGTTRPVGASELPGSQSPPKPDGPLDDAWLGDAQELSEHSIAMLLAKSDGSGRGDDPPEVGGV